MTLHPPGVGARLIAFYLPQFHPIAENDGWWGPGFTEWRNVATARPLFDGHYQPHVPGELGYYDLRLPEVREAQAELAAAHGIEGFCYWHYWFRGKRLLERPVDELLASGRPALPFCLAWANEAWTRTWLGDEKEILQAQTYGAEDDLRHARWLAEVFTDPRYLRVGGRPLFLVYRPADLPFPRRTTAVLRSECSRLGVPEPLLLGINAHRDLDFRALGFDGSVCFEPLLSVTAALEPLAVAGNDPGVEVYDYAEARQRMADVTRSWDVHPSILVGWDNTPRRGARGTVFANAGPEAFRAGLQRHLAAVAERPFEERLIFINAWNEWAEGNHLEPDRRYGRAYLEAVRSANCPAPMEVA